MKSANQIPICGTVLIRIMCLAGNMFAIVLAVRILSEMIRWIRNEIAFLLLLSPLLLWFSFILLTRGINGLYYTLLTFSMEEEGICVRLWRWTLRNYPASEFRYSYLYKMEAQANGDVVWWLCISKYSVEEMAKVAEVKLLKQKNNQRMVSSMKLKPNGKERLINLHLKREQRRAWLCPVSKEYLWLTFTPELWTIIRAAYPDMLLHRDSIKRSEYPGPKENPVSTEKVCTIIRGDREWRGYLHTYLAVSPLTEGEMVDRITERYQRDPVKMLRNIPGANRVILYWYMNKTFAPTRKKNIIQVQYFDCTCELEQMLKERYPQAEWIDATWDSMCQ